MILQPAIVVLTVLAGLILGSMVTTAALRSARAEQAVTGRSHCDGCGRGLSYVDTLPLVSFLWLRGACARCKAPIDRLHPLGELAGLVAIGAAFWIAPPMRAALVALLGLALIAAAVLDQRTGRVPDPLILALALLGAALAVTVSPARLAVGLAAAALCFGVVLGVTLLIPRGRGGPNPGEIKLAAAAAVWLGAATPWMIGPAALFGLLAFTLRRPGGGRAPYGPMIAMAGFAAGLWQEAMLTR